MRARQFYRGVVALLSAAALAVLATSAVAGETVASPPGWTKPVTAAHPGRGLLVAPSFATTPQGDKVAVWGLYQSPSDASHQSRVGVYAIVKRAGHAWPAHPVELTPAHNFDHEDRPVVASSTDGRIVVVWYSNRAQHKDRPARYAILEPGASHFTPERAMPELPGTSGLLSEPVGLIATPDGAITAVWSETGQLHSSGTYRAISASATLAAEADHWSRPLAIYGEVQHVGADKQGSLVAQLVGYAGHGASISRLPVGAAHWSKPQRVTKLQIQLSALAVGEDGTVALAFSNGISVQATVAPAGSKHFTQLESVPPPGNNRPSAQSLSLVVTPDGSATLSYENQLDRDPHAPPVPVVIESHSPSGDSPPQVRFVYEQWVVAYDAAARHWSSVTRFEGPSSRAFGIALQTTSKGRVIAVWGAQKPYLAGDSEPSYLRSAQAPAGSPHFAPPRTFATGTLAPAFITLVPSPSGSLAAFWAERNVMSATLAGG